MVPRCPRRPIIVSSSFAFEVPEARMLLIKSVQAMNLVLGKEIMRRRKSRYHSRIILSSSSLALASKLILAPSPLVE